MVEGCAQTAHGAASFQKLLPASNPSSGFAEHGRVCRTQAGLPDDLLEGVGEALGGASLPQAFGMRAHLGAALAVL